MTTQEVRQIATDRLIYNLCHTVYVEAMRRTSAIMDNKTRWLPGKVAATERELDTLRRVIRAYYAA